MSDIQNQRKAHEELATMLKSGYFKLIIEAQKMAYDEYIKQGFDKDQALTLTMNLMSSK